MFETIRAQLQAQLAVGGMTPEIEAELAELDRREQALAAADTDDATLRALADAELTDVQAQRVTRQRLRSQRFALMVGRAATLTAHDGSADAVAAVAADIRSWPGGAAHPELGPVATVLEAISARSRGERSKPWGERTDDLDVDLTDLTDVLRNLGDALAAAERQLAGVTLALTRRTDNLVAVNREAP